MGEARKKVMWYDSYTGERMASGSLRVFGHVNDAGRFLLDQGVPQAGIPLGRLGDSPVPGPMGGRDSPWAGDSMRLRSPGSTSAQCVVDSHTWCTVWNVRTPVSGMSTAML